MEAHISTYCDLNTKDEALESCIEGLQSSIASGPVPHDKGVLEVIRLSEAFLTSAEEKVRTRATALLGGLLSRRDNDHSSSSSLSSSSSTLALSTGTIHHLIDFFRRRLEDYPSLLPSINALKTIFRYYHGSVDSSHNDAYESLRYILDEINVQGVSQSIRQQIYDLISIILSNESLLLETLEHGGDILAGIIGITEGERDPRCLIRSLQLLSLAMKCYPQSAYECSELVFDNIAGYFPITFRPAANDPYGITASMLIDSLNDVFCCHPAMAAHCIPFLTDKLGAEDVSTDGKLDALDCLCRLARLPSRASSVVNGYAVAGSNTSSTAVSSSSTKPSQRNGTSTGNAFDTNSTALTPFLNTLPSLANVLYGFVAAGASSGSMSNLSSGTDNMKSASSERLCMLGALECISTVCALISSSNKSSSSKAEAAVGYQRFISPLLRSAIKDSALKRRSTAAASVTIDSLSCLTALRVVAAIASASFELFALVLLRMTPVYLRDIDDQMKRARRLVLNGDTTNTNTNSGISDVSPTAIAFIEVLLRSLPSDVDHSGNIASQPALLDALKSIFVRLQRCICLFDANNQVLDINWTAIEDAHIDEWMEHAKDLASYVSGFTESESLSSESDCGSGASGGGCCGGGSSNNESSGCCGGSGSSSSLKQSHQDSSSGCCGGGGNSHSDHGNDHHDHHDHSDSGGCCGGSNSSSSSSNSGGCCQEKEEKEGGNDGHCHGSNSHSHNCCDEKNEDANSLEALDVSSDKYSSVMPLIAKSVQCINVLIKRFFVAVNFPEAVVCLAHIGVDLVVNNRIRRPSNSSSNTNALNTTATTGSTPSISSDLINYMVSLLCTLYEVRGKCADSVTAALDVVMDSLLAMITSIGDSSNSTSTNTNKTSPKEAVYTLLTRLCISEWGNSKSTSTSTSTSSNLGAVAIRTVDALVTAVTNSDNVDIRSASLRGLLELLTGRSVITQSAFASNVHMEVDITKAKSTPSRVLFDETDRILDVLNTDVYVNGTDTTTTTTTTVTPVPLASSSRGSSSWLAPVNRYKISTTSSTANDTSTAYATSAKVISTCSDFALQLALHLTQRINESSSINSTTISTNTSGNNISSKSGLFQLVSCAIQRPLESYEISLTCEILRVAVFVLTTSASTSTTSTSTITGTSAESTDYLCTGLVSLIDIDTSNIAYDLTTLARLRLINSAINGISAQSELLQNSNSTTSSMLSPVIAKLLTICLAIIESSSRVSVSTSGSYIPLTSASTSVGASTSTSNSNSNNSTDSQIYKRAKVAKSAINVPCCDNYSTGIQVSEAACWIVATLINKLPASSELLQAVLHNVFLVIRMGTESVAMRPKHDGIDALSIAITSDLALWTMKALLMRYDLPIDDALLEILDSDSLGSYMGGTSGSEEKRSWQRVYLDWFLNLAAHSGSDSSGYGKMGGSGELKRPAVASAMSLHLPKPSNPFSFMSNHMVTSSTTSSAAVASDNSAQSDIDLDMSYHGGLLNLRLYLGSRCFIIPDANASNCFTLTDIRCTISLADDGNTVSGATVLRSPMWMQKLSHVLLAPLLDIVSGAAKVTDLAPLWAVCGLISTMPSNIVFGDKNTTPAIVRIVVLALQMGMQMASDRSHSIYHIDDTVVTRLSSDALATLHELLMQDKRPVFIGPHLATILPILIQFTRHSSSGGAPVFPAYERGRACDCILRLSLLPYPLLHPHQKAVIKGLKVAIDDPKRFVRRLAVKARNEWSVISDA